MICEDTEHFSTMHALIICDLCMHMKATLSSFNYFVQRQSGREMQIPCPLHFSLGSSYSYQNKDSESI